MTDPVMERLVAPADLAEQLAVTVGQLAQMRYLGAWVRNASGGLTGVGSMPDVQTAG